MKMRKVAALCRKYKAAEIYVREANMGGTVQYIGVGGIYCTDGLPLLDADTVCAVMEAPLQQRKDWLVRVRRVAEHTALLVDTVGGKSTS